MQGKFIAIEGLDGAGKSTAIDFIKEFLDNKKSKTIYTREPGGTAIAENIRHLTLKKHESEEMHPDTELLLMYASRTQHIHGLIKPNLAKGINVISDRFYWSSIAYQGGGRELDLAKINSLNTNFITSCEPNLIIYLDIEPLVGLQRAKKVDSPDRIEQAGLDFFIKTRQMFKQLVKESSTAIEIDASLPLEKIKKEIFQILTTHFS